MARKKKLGLKRTDKSGPLHPVTTKLNNRAFSGKLGALSFGFEVEKYGKHEYRIFKAKFAARKYLDLLIKDDDIKWLNQKQKRLINTDPELTTSSEVWISGSKLREIFEYKYKSKSVKLWELPDEYKLKAEYIRSEREYIPPPPLEQRKRVSRKGMILIGDISKEVDIHPRDARGILRALDFKKPKHGWAWQTRAEADKIKKTLQQSRRKTQHLVTDDEDEV